MTDKSSVGAKDRRFPGALTIAPHVHVCVTGDGSVLLDLKRDKYLGVGRDATELLANAVAVWPKPKWNHSTERSGSTEAGAETLDLLRSLATEGVLIPAIGQCANEIFLPVDYMKRDWISMGDELEVDVAVNKTHVANFIAAFLWARGSLALRPFRVTVETIRAQKTRHGSDVDSTHVLELAGLVGVFRWLRPFLFAADGRCLLHALTLIKYLSRHGFYPDWVVGVATRPWGAHSWVQWGNFLLDTSPDKVCRYTPIMVV